jgi:hypothetical protein
MSKKKSAEEKEESQKSDSQNKSTKKDKKKNESTGQQILDDELQDEFVGGKVGENQVVEDAPLSKEEIEGFEVNVEDAPKEEKETAQDLIKVFDKKSNRNRALTQAEIDAEPTRYRIR